MSISYEFGDGRPIVKVCFDADGWEWFRDLVYAQLETSDGFRQDVEQADAYLFPPEEPE